MSERINSGDKLSPAFANLIKKHNINVFEFILDSEFECTFRTNDLITEELKHDLCGYLGSYTKINFSKLPKRPNSVAKVFSNVNHPTHYNSGKIEVIEALEDWKLSFHRANAVKYVARAGKKDASKEIEDLEKAVWYLKRDIELLRAAKESREVVRPNAMNPEKEYV